MDVCKVDKIVIRGLLEMSFSGRSMKMCKIKDGQLCPPLPNVKYIDKDKKRAKFHFKLKNLSSKNFKFLCFADNGRVKCDYIYINLYNNNNNNNKWVPVTAAWRVLRLRMGERPPIRRVAANILNKQSRTAD
jgi:hypothetical protein